MSDPSSSSTPLLARNVLIGAGLIGIGAMVSDTQTAADSEQPADAQTLPLPHAAPPLTPPPL